MLYVLRINPITNGGRVFDRTRFLWLLTKKSNFSYVTFIFEDLCKVSHSQTKGGFDIWHHFQEIVYKIIIVIDNSALIDFLLLIMSWKQFMKNNAIIFVFKNSYCFIIFTNDSISLFSIWRLPLGNMIKALSGH